MNNATIASRKKINTDIETQKFIKGLQAEERLKNANKIVNSINMLVNSHSEQNMIYIKSMRYADTWYVALADDNSIVYNTCVNYEQE